MTIIHEPKMEMKKGESFESEAQAGVISPTSRIHVKTEPVACMTTNIQLDLQRLVLCKGNHKNHKKTHLYQLVLGRNPHNLSLRSSETALMVSGGIEARMLYRIYHSSVSFFHTQQ
jgi:hypothetical protein